MTDAPNLLTRKVIVPAQLRPHSRNLCDITAATINAVLTSRHEQRQCADNTAPLSPKLQRPYVLRQTRQDGRPSGFRRPALPAEFVLRMQHSTTISSNPGTLERQNLPHSQRHAANGCERFGIELSKRPQPSTFTSAKHRAHFFAQSEGISPRARSHTHQFIQ